MVKKISFGLDKSRQRLFFLLMSVLFVVLGVVANSANFVGAVSAGAILFGLGLLGLVFIGFSGILDPSKTASELIGIDANWGRDIIEGVGYGIVLIGAILIFPVFAFFLPTVPQAISAAGVGSLYQFILAPVAEETVFRGGGRWLLIKKFKLNKILALGLTTAAFVIFHFTFYGGDVAATPFRYIAVAMFGVITFYLADKQKSLIGAIATHATGNIGVGLLFGPAAALVGGVL